MIQGDTTDPAKPFDDPKAGTELAVAPVEAGPVVVADRTATSAGANAAKRYANFFGSIKNDNTRAAYQRACQSFFAWCEAHGTDDLADVVPFHVGAYNKTIGATFAKPTVKQHLAAIRMLFDWLVTGHIVRINPATSVRM